jgi:hypothetical protein
MVLLINKCFAVSTTETAHFSDEASRNDRKMNSAGLIFIRRATARSRMTETRVVIQQEFYEIGERSIGIDRENKREQGTEIRKQH